jgi:L-threonylcarbamoyladenylate synthase
MDKEIKKAIAVLKKGGIVAYPTDTAYGLAADASNEKAVRKLYQLKGRDFNKPVHVIFPDMNWLSRMVVLNVPALKLMNRFLPGPLTLVLPMKIEGVSWEMLSAGTGTLGIRLPDDKMALGLVRGFGRPITTTSANVSGGENAYSIAEVKKQFAEQGPDYYLDGGRLKKKKPSTVVALDGNNAKILREGPISEKEIKKVLEK